MGEEAARRAPGAVGGDRHLFTSNAHPYGSLSEDGAKIDGGRAIGDGLAERLEDLAPYFVARRAYRRAEVHVEALGSGAILRHHRCEAGLEDTGRRASPPCMHGRDRTLPPIDDERRHTVGGRNGQYDARARRHVAVAVVDDIEAIHPCVFIGERRRDVWTNGRFVELTSVYRLPGTGGGDQRCPPAANVRFRGSFTVQPQIKGIASVTPHRRSLNQPGEPRPPLGMHESGRRGDPDVVYATEIMA